MRAKDYTLIDWHSYFEYSEESPSGLVWKIPRLFKGVENYKRVGQPVGSKVITKNNSYWSVGLTVEGVRFTYALHRVIWVMFNGQVDINNDIDHLDGNGLNNNISNLRECTKSVNSRNQRIRIDNKTGTNSIFYEKTRTGEGFRACVVGEDGSKYRKFFSIGKYGENARLLAEEWKIDKLQEMGNAGFTERHGKEIL